MMISLFCRKFKYDPFWPKLGQTWPKFGHSGCQKFLIFFPSFCKNWKKYFGQKNPLFTIFTHCMTSTHLKIFEMPKTEVLHFFSKTADWNFLIFCMKSSLWSRKYDCFAFLSKIHKWPILAQIGPNLTKIWAFSSPKIFNFFFLLFLQKSKKIILGKKIHFHHFYPLHDLPLPTQILFIFCFFPKMAKIILGENFVILGLKWVTRIGPRMSACSLFCVSGCMQMWRHNKYQISM